LFNLNTKLETFIREKKIEISGFCSSELLENAPETFRPSRYLQEARSLISLAVHLDTEIIKALPDTMIEYMKEFDRVNKILDEGAIYISEKLKEMGYLSIVIPNRDPDHWTKRRGDLSHRHVARVAGLGEFGYNNLLLVPDYYGAVRFSSIITSASLKPTPKANTPTCRKCKKCIDLCPTGALLPVDNIKSNYNPEIGRYMEQEICRKYQISLNKKRCGLCMAACLKSN